MFAGAEDDRTFEPILLSELLPQFPTGNLNNGHAARDPGSGKAGFIKTERVQFEGVKNLWHPRRSVLAKLAVWPWEIAFMDVETSAYQLIQNSGVGPKFLGHLTEGDNWRVIGFVTECVEDARAAGSEAFDGCMKALSLLHGLGIALGDINKDDFLMRMDMIWFWLTLRWLGNDVRHQNSRMR